MRVPSETSLLFDPHAQSSLIVELLGEGTPVRFVASGRSMLPTVRDGDYLTVMPQAQACLRPGCIALYRNGDTGLTAHRVLSITEQAGEGVLRIRGDASRGLIDDIPVANVLGIVTRVSRGGRDVRVDTFLRRQIGLTRARLRTLKTHLGLLVRSWVAPA